MPRGTDFDSSTGKLKNEKLLQLDEEQANELAARLRTADFQVTKVEVKPFTQRPLPPFTTSTMQQEANRKLGFTAKRAMQAPPSDSTRTVTSPTCVPTAPRCRPKRSMPLGTLSAANMDPTFCILEVRVYKGKVKNAQEAHEAIRPAGTPFRVPETIRGELDSDQFRLFDLIWKRTVACQMADAKKQRISVTIEGGGARLYGQWDQHPVRRVLASLRRRQRRPREANLPTRKMLPNVAQSDPLDPDSLDPKGHTTQPPARYTEASLTQTLEEKGIGRPSTFASIIGTITDERRNYIVKKGSALVPTWRAFSVTRLMEVHFGTLVDYEFTAQLEDFLDSISRDEAERDDYLRKFYFGDDSTDKHNVGLKHRLVEKLDQIDAKESAMFSMGTPESGQHQAEVFVRVGKFGPYLEQADRTARSRTGWRPTK